MPLRRSLIVIAFALGVLGASAVPAGAATRNLWSTVNVCDSQNHPDDVGIAARMPGGARGYRMYMRFYVQYLDGEDWRFVKEGGKSPWVLAGSDKFSWIERGWTFSFNPPPAGTAYTFRGFVRFEWRRGKKKVVKRTHRYTSAGHPGTAEADPKDYSARKCKIAGPPVGEPQPPPYEDPNP